MDTIMIVKTCRAMVALVPVLDMEETKIIMPMATAAEDRSSARPCHPRDRRLPLTTTTHRCGTTIMMRDRRERPITRRSKTKVLTWPTHPPEQRRPFITWERHPRILSPILARYRMPYRMDRPTTRPVTTRTLTLRRLLRKSRWGSCCYLGSNTR